MIMIIIYNLIDFFLSIIYYMYSFRLIKRNNIKNPKQIKFGLFKLNNIKSSNNSLKSPIISRINQKNYSCGGCGRK